MHAMPALSPGAVPQARGELDPGATAPLTVLLLEDSATDALLTREQLRSVRPDVVFDHVQRLEDVDPARARAAGCALVDLSLPDATGIDVVRAVRRLAPSLPIIVLTGLDDVGTGIEALRVGAQDYLVKNHADGFALDRAVRYAMERLRLEQQVLQQALRDPLTGLPNRAVFSDRTRHALAVAHRLSEPVVVLLADLDGFKDVNDSLGHVAGDELLVQVAQRLSSVVRPSDTLARLGGDEFVVLCGGRVSREQAEGLAGRLSDALAAPFLVQGGQAVHVGVSIGIAESAVGVLDDGVMLRDADTALYEAKAAGRGRVSWFTSELRSRTVSRVTLETALREAVRTRSGLSVVCQPVVRVEDASVVMVEALARWEGVGEGGVPPLSFVPLAERSNLIVELDLHVLDLALDQLAAGQHGGPEVRLSVNAAGRTLRSRGYVDRVAQTLGAHGVDPHRLTVEILETALLDEDGLRAVRLLHELGVRIALDDFGAGPSSLHNVLATSVDCLKLDRSFVVAAARGDRRAAAVLRAIAQMGHDLGVEIVAEGIETPADLAVVRALGVRLAQGYLWGRP